jgi:hypothetical protein
MAGIPFSQVLLEELARIEKRREAILRISAGVTGPERLVPGGSEPSRGDRERLEAELRAWLAARGMDPETAGEDARLTAARGLALERHLAGLAFSGGGIRSATFCIGILQGLAGLKLLRFFDVLSTVSGGGYAGGWLAAWMAREGNPVNVEKQLSVSRIEQARARRIPREGAGGLPEQLVVDDEPEPIRHLRQYSSYLNPRPGLFSIDTWALLAIYSRNVLINLLLIWPVLMALVLVLRYVVWTFTWASAIPPNRIGYELAAVLGLATAALGMNALILWRIRRSRPTGEAPAGPGVDLARWVPWAMIYGVVFPLLGAAILLSLSFEPGLNATREALLAWIARDRAVPALLLGAVVSVAVAFLFGPYLLKRLFRPVLLGAVAAAVLAAVLAWWGRALEEQGGRLRWLLLLPSRPEVGCALVAAVVALLVLALVRRLEFPRDRAEAKPRRAGSWASFVALALGSGLVCYALISARFWEGLVPVFEALRSWLSGRGVRLGNLETLMLDSLGSAYYLSWPNVVLHAGVFGLLGGLVSGVFMRSERQQGWLPIPTAAFCAGMVGGVMVAISEELLRFTLNDALPWLLATIGPALLLVDVVIALAVLIALLGPTASEGEREFWGRLAGLLLITAAFWMAALAIVVYGPALLYAAGSARSAVLAAAWAGLTSLGVRLGSGVFGTTAAAPGAKTTSSWVTRLVLAVAPTVFLVGLLAFVALAVAFLINEDWNAQPAPPARSSGAEQFFWYVRAYFVTLRGTRLHVIGLWLGLLAAVIAGASLFVNVNLFSLHALYANRLTRTFLGASRRRREWADRWGSRRAAAATAGAPTGSQGPARRPNPFTGFDPEDEIDLFDLGIGRRLPLNAFPPRYWGPHLILNTALNLVGGDELAWRDRKAESFALTPLYCGAKSTGFAEVTDETCDRLRLGRSVALSGAAVDPNMNLYQSAPLTVLLTIFNARLGAWMQNPDPGPAARDWLRGGEYHQNWEPGEERWGARGATASYLLFRELLGSTQGRGRYVHVSDGGHFENLGVYELIRRRCRYIVAVDATENPNPTSDNLGILVRLCRVDFGIRLQLDTTPLTLQGPDRRSRAHIVMGQIRYDDVDGGAVPGVFVYVRASMTGDEPPDVQQYRDLHPEFPRQWTLTDQSFDEDQFESYRTLGDHIAHTVFEDAARAVYEDHSEGDADPWWQARWPDGFPALPSEVVLPAIPPEIERLARKLDQRAGVIGPASLALYEALRRRHEEAVAEYHAARLGLAVRDAFRLANVRLFGELQDRWSDMPFDQDERYLESTRAWVTLHRDLRENADLAEISQELYPELEGLARGGNAGRLRAELHTVEQILQLMEDAWLALGLRGYNALPMNRGWMNCFRRLTGTAAFRRLWPILRAEYSPEFVRFCEQQLRLASDTPRLEPLDSAGSPDIAALAAELAREWPDLIERSAGETLEQAGLRHVAEALRDVNRWRNALLDPWVSIWRIVEEPRQHSPAEWPPGAITVGLLVLRSLPDGHPRKCHADYELLLWLRRAHRAVGIGGKVLDRDPYKRAEEGILSQGRRICVWYPKTPASVGDNRLRSQWLSFFSLHDFRPPVGQILRPGEEWVLVKQR